MRRAIAVALTIGLVAGAMVGSADAAKKKKKVSRVIEHSYSAPSPGIGGAPYSACLGSQMDDAGCVNVPLGSDDKFVNVEIADAAGQQVYWILAQDTDTTDVGYNIFHYGCGNSEEPVPVTPGLELRISVYATGGARCPGAATTGTVTATLTNLP